MRLSRYMIDLMIEGLSRIKRIPEKEWLEPIIQRLNQLQPGETLVIERRQPGDLQ